MALMVSIFNLAPLVGCSTGSVHNGDKLKSTEKTSIATAPMHDDGSIDLMLRAEGPGGMLGDSFKTFKKDDKNYEMVLNHIGGLKPGEVKPVPPWPEQ